MAPEVRKLTLGPSQGAVGSNVRASYGVKVLFCTGGNFAWVLRGENGLMYRLVHTQEFPLCYFFLGGRFLCRHGDVLRL